MTYGWFTVHLFTGVPACLPATGSAAQQVDHPLVSVGVRNYCDDVMCRRVIHVFSAKSNNVSV